MIAHCGGHFLFLVSVWVNKMSKNFQILKFVTVKSGEAIFCLDEVGYIFKIYTGVPFLVLSQCVELIRNWYDSEQI